MLFSDSGPPSPTLSTYTLMSPSMLMLVCPRLINHSGRCERMTSYMFDAEAALISSVLSTRVSRRPEVRAPDEDEAHAAVTSSNAVRATRRDGRMVGSIERKRLRTLG